MWDVQPGSDPLAEPAESPGGARKRRDPGDRAQPFASRRVLGMRVDATSYAETADRLLQMAASGSGGMVCCATAHMVMEGFDAPEFRRLVNSAERVTPDGMALVWALRWLGIPDARRVYGPDLTLEVCARAASRGVPVGFYGGRPQVLERLGSALRERFPGLRIPFAWSPPFRPLRPDEEARVLEAIEASGVGVLFVGLGCPKQERWMAAHRERLGCALVGVGAAFDFLSGAKAQAPRVVQRLGLEWLFRLAHEPRRLWRRYLLGNTRFLFHFLLRGNPV